MTTTTTIDATPETPATPAPTLIAAAEDAALLAAWIREADESGELDEGALPDYLEELSAMAEQPLKAKAERLGMAIRARETDVDAIDLELKRLQARKKARENEIARMKRYGQLCLEIAGETKVTTPLVTLRVQANPPAVKGELSADALQGLWEQASPLVRYVPATYALDKKAALDLHKQGQPLPEGLTVERSSSLRVA